MTYLIDVNLPKSFLRIKTITCLFVKDISDEMADEEIWKMAISGEHIILTRDKDFYYKSMQCVVIPKIILFRLGNCRGNELFEYFDKNLAVIDDYLSRHQLLVLWPGEIQVVI